ncbi:hypothetical protein JL721_12746 [Aureococcus anophagefferens]|nr:hypothetical protein JL721_12746 [Aureococcus anophagefferens]
MAEELLLEPGFLSQTLRSAHETAAEAEACADEARAAALHERAAQGYHVAACLGETWAEARSAPSRRPTSDDGAPRRRAAQTRRPRRRPSRAVERLAAANAALVAERDDLRRDAESRAIKAEMVAFKALSSRSSTLCATASGLPPRLPVAGEPGERDAAGRPGPAKSAVDLEAENAIWRSLAGAA